MMQQMSGGGGAPAMGSLPGMGKRAKARQQPAKKKGNSGSKKGRSGNPAKRAQQEREAAQKKANQPKGSAFGVSQNNNDDTPDLNELAKFLR